MERVTCLDCGRVCVPNVNSVGTGYATLSDGSGHVCYACCAVRDLSDMRQTGKALLYDVDDHAHKYRHLTGRNWECGHVTNWPSSLRFNITYRKRSRHNTAGWRYDVWFTVTYPDGVRERWWGYRVGDGTQVVHCRRVVRD